jgi:hypothetical protein
MFSPLDPVSTASFPITTSIYWTTKKHSPLPAAYFLHVVHCSMHRKKVMPSFGSASNAHTMSCCATTTRSSFDPLFRWVTYMVSLHPPSLAHHNRTQVAIHAVPRRDDFFTRIAEGGSVEKLHIELAKWLDALDALVIRLSGFLREGNYGRV